MRYSAHEHVPIVNCLLLAFCRGRVGVLIVKMAASRNVRWIPVLALGVLSIVLSLTGCGGRRMADNPFQRSETEETVILRVENRNMHDARIYVRPRGRRTHLATIEARDMRYYEFPWPGGMPLDLEVELTVGGRFRPPPLMMTPGIRVNLIIAPSVRRSILRQ